MRPYVEFVGRLIDMGNSNTQIAYAILKADDAGKITIPFKVWAVCDRFRIMENSGSRVSRKALRDQFNANSPVTFFVEPKWVRQFRHILQSEDRSFTTLEKRSTLQRKVLEKLPQIDDWFGSGKRQNLQNLNILTDKFTWSEVGFQHMIGVLKKASRRKINPHAETFRLWVNGMADMDGTLRKRELPFDWMLCADHLSSIHRNDARKIAGIILSEINERPIQIKGTITATQVRQINKVMAWFHDPIQREKLQYLVGLSWLVSATGYFANWDRIEKAIVFAVHQQKKPPDFDLLKDYMQGLVDFDGRGEYRL